MPCMKWRMEDCRRIYLEPGEITGIHGYERFREIYTFNTEKCISVAMKALTKQGYVVRDKYEGINLTPEGEKIAKKIYARHQLLKEFLEGIGVGSETADHDACRIEHTISDETYECLKKLVDRMKKADIIQIE